MNDNDSCSQCGNELSRDSLSCPNCGQRRGPSQKSSPGTIVLMIFLGIICGAPLALFSGVAGISLQPVDVRAAPGNHGGLPPIAIYYIAVTLLLFIGLIVTARSRMNLSMRVFTVTMLTTALGLFALCDASMFGSR